jgi:hypothetical protein
VVQAHDWFGVSGSKGEFTMVCLNLPPDLFDLNSRFVLAVFLEKDVKYLIIL